MVNTKQTISFAGAHGNALVADSQGEDASDTILLLHGGGQTRHAWGNRQSASPKKAGARALADQPRSPICPVPSCLSISLRKSTQSVSTEF